MTILIFANGTKILQPDNITTTDITIDNEKPTEIIPNATQEQLQANFTPEELNQLTGGVVQLKT